MPKRNFPKLSESIEIGKILVRNRVLMPAMSTFTAIVDHFVTDRMVSYYAKGAEGGVGLIIIAGTSIDDPIGIGLMHQLCMDDDKYIPGLNELAEAIHSHGGKNTVQLHHVGPNIHFEGARQEDGKRPYAGQTGGCRGEEHERINGG